MVENEEKDKKTQTAILLKEPEENEKSEILIEKQHKKFKLGKTILISLLILFIIIFSIIFAVLNLQSKKIVKGVTIAKIDLSDKTKEEAKQILEDIYLSKSEKEIYLKHKEYETAITYKSLEVEYQIENAVREAYNIGRNGNIFLNNIEILKSWIIGENINLEATIDSDMINQVAQNINNSIKDAIVQPSYYIEEDKLIITSGKEGYKVDENQLLEDIYKVLNTETEDEQQLEIPIIKAKPENIDIEKIHQEVCKKVQDAYYTKEPFKIYPESDGIEFKIEEAKKILLEEKTEYEIPLTITKPSKTINEIGTEAFPDLLAKFSTKYVASNVNRTTNLRLAANKINGTVIMPGKEFSYNKVVGERTIQAGYKEAATYSNGQVVNGIGGGICQISSTLYDAVIMANLNVTTRRNHQFVTSYVPAGKDATVVWGSQDFKFINSRKNPIKIEATVSGGNNGRKVEAYKVVKQNGKVVSTTLLSKDTYIAMKKIVHVGTAGQ